MFYWTDEESEAQRGGVTGTKSHSKQEAGLDQKLSFNPSDSGDAGGLQGQTADLKGGGGLAVKPQGNSGHLQHPCPRGNGQCQANPCCAGSWASAGRASDDSEGKLEIWVSVQTFLNFKC